jgi:5,10-methylenetetrahydromethanopterin reductase
MILALAAGRTRVIGLGPAALVPSLRHPVVTAAALATLAGLAPGRVTTAFGTGLTGRMLLGERPLRWAAVEEYVRTVRALLRGDEASWNGSLVRLAQPSGFAAGRPADVTVLIAANGPRGRAVAAGLGDGVLTTRVPRDLASQGSRQVLVAFGTVLDDGEDATSPRAVAAAGPAVAAAYHAIYESKGAAGVEKLPGGREWREAMEAVEGPRRHFAVHDGHLVGLGKHDEALLARAAPLLASWTMTGTRADIGARLRALSSAGITEVAYQPMGPDIPRELTAFAAAAGQTDTAAGDA